MQVKSSVAIGISWCLAWGNGRKPQFDISVLREMWEALRTGGEVPVEVRTIVEQVEDLQKIKEDYFPETLEQLKKHYPVLWNQTTNIGLVYGGVTKVKQYVFESAKIQEVRGASGLLDRINLVDLPAFFNVKNLPQIYNAQCSDVRAWLNKNFDQDYKLSEVLIPELIIYSTGGNILAFCPAAYVNDLADAIEKRYTHETLTANSCAVGDTFRPLEIRFGLFKEKIEDTPWLDWYNQNYQKPIVQAYFGFPKDEKERLEGFRNRKSFNEITTKLAVLFNQRRSGNDIPGRNTNRRYPAMFETHPYLIRDGSDRRSAMMRVDEGLARETNFSEASVRKYLVGDRAKDGDTKEPEWYLKTNLKWHRGIFESWVKRFDRFLEEHPHLKTKYYGNIQPQNVEIPKTLTHVSNASKGFIAYIYADGNNMGGYIQKIRTPEKYKKFSLDVSVATEEAVFYALAENLHPHELRNLNDEDSQLKNGQLVHPFEIITIGGDDIFTIVPANKALEISQIIGEKFEEIMIDKSDEIADYRIEQTKPVDKKKIHRYQPQTAKPSECKLSTSIGVLITADDTPIYYAQDLVTQLLKSAKEKAKKLKKVEYHGGTIDFITLKSVTMIASNIKDFRQEALTKESPQKLKLYAGPYTLHEIGGLIKSILALKKTKFPKSQLYQIRSLLERGKHTAILNYRYFRVRLKQGKTELQQHFEDAWCLPKDDKNGGNLAPWMYDTDDKVYETIWRDMVDIYGFVEESDNTGQLGQLGQLEQLEQLEQLGDITPGVES
ncbi:type III-B CRISPR-associated protein Cas10/Cmr2 [Sphaerospermopsis sp. LEGE 08334]|uniref:type III-B CRISPR-associated protein Cas10/Cmr2 n=1 Tax=Sphaerospermopsis sp. LEGE 08334 TaxID=1828651 RepID=UPI00188199A5|nr:type III-B CRISPR-associated protein Cas10/Cmr2 [Sphaerospermopsis sp. LEGE 08334]MBE9055748.1 type III-B CRISPR-associated protein Cas10/Cmr2 [Sphaerospermopsis sp. LEGE 08334]